MTILKELEKTVQSLINAQKELEQIKKEQQAQSREIFELKRQLEEVSILPKWIPTSRACEILGIKKSDTLKGYAKKGLLEMRLGHDHRNYFLRDEVMGLPEKLFEVQNQKI